MNRSIRPAGENSQGIIVVLKFVKMGLATTATAAAVGAGAVVTGIVDTKDIRSAYERTTTRAGLIAEGVIDKIAPPETKTASLETKPAVVDPEEIAKQSNEVPAEEKPADQASTAKPDPVAGSEEKQDSGVVVPAFDVLRVEEDGSILVAGRAEPHSSVYLSTPGGDVIGETKAGAEGDFVILPNEPLPPGDYQLSLVSRTTDGQQISSSEVSVVHVPETGGEVLAMITPDGQASRIITLPKSIEAPTIADSKPEQAKPADTKQVGAPKVEGGDIDAATLNAKPEKPETAETEIAAVNPDENTVAADPETQTEVSQKPSVSTSVTDDTTPKIEVETAATENKQPADVEKSEEGSVEIAALDPAKPEPSTEVIAEETRQPAEIKPQQDAAKAETPATVEPNQQPVPQASAPQVIVEAVEVEGGQVFVAGAVKKGAMVRVYIDNESIGVTGGTIDDRFLIARDFNLTPGEHLVRADVVDRKTGQVISRAEVPLVHEELEIGQAEPQSKPVETPSSNATPETAEPSQSTVAISNETDSDAKPAVTEQAETVTQSEVKVAINVDDQTVKAPDWKAAETPKIEIEVPKANEEKPESSELALVEPKKESDNSSGGQSVTTQPSTEASEQQQTQHLNAETIAAETSKSEELSDDQNEIAGTATKPAESESETVAGAAAAQAIESPTPAAQSNIVDNNAIAAVTDGADNAATVADSTTSLNQATAEDPVTAETANAGTPTDDQNDGATKPATKIAQSAVPAAPSTAVKADEQEVQVAAVQSTVSNDANQPKTAPQPTKIEKPHDAREGLSETQPSVIRTGSAIIIKPGDNLWRISRKTYGRGIRYTTIYNANRDQIRDPNRIYIGQIFKIPKYADQ